MNRFDRILGILLFLRSRPTVSAAELAKHFVVSRRTIYRDVEALSALGVPLYAERGREGGFRLLEGYFLPPLMFTQSEAVTLLVGLTLQRSLQAPLFPAEMAMAEKKLLAALPEKLRAMLEKAETLLAFEKPPYDIFHPEPELPQVPPGVATTGGEPAYRESATISVFFQALLAGNELLLRYYSPYRGLSTEVQMLPLGLLWDRDYWYLVGRQSDRQQPLRLWRADRVLNITVRHPIAAVRAGFDVRELAGRNWLLPAMEQWRERAPVKILLSPVQARRLQQDWYYRHAYFEPCPDNERIMLTFGESDPAIVLALLRWLGPGAELIEPDAWREKIKEELRQMLAAYS